jgi:hypothetical protein
LAGLGRRGGAAASRTAGCLLTRRVQVITQWIARRTDDRALAASVLRISALVLGVLLCAIAAAAIPLGLGEATDFIFFRWWGIPRKTTFYVGAILALVSVIPDPRPLLAKRPPVALKQEFISEALPTRPSELLRTLSGQLLLAALVAIGAFFLNRRNLLGYIDGQYLLTLGRNQSEFMGPIFGFSTNPLQGLGDLWFFTNTRWIPELSVSRLLTDPEWQRIAVHTLALLEIFCVTFLLADWLYASLGKAAASAWLAVLMISPITYPGLIYNISYDAPELATLTALPLLIVPLWARTGRGALWSDAVCIVGIGLLLWLHFVAFSLFTALVYPFLMVVGLIFLVASWRNKNEFWRKLICASALLVLLIVSGLPQALLGITLDTAFYLFPERLMPSAHALSDGSILLRLNQPVGVALAGLGLLGAACQVRFGDERRRWFASAVLILVLLIICTSVFYAVAGSSGAKPIYYEYVLWPVYAIFAVPFLAIAGRAGWRLFASAWPPIAQRQPRWPWLVLPLAAVLILHSRNYLSGAMNERPNIYPPKMTPLVEYLRGEIALAPGAPFRGRVTTITGQNVRGGVTWDQMFGFDMELIRSVGNDHRTIGLWYYNIPTLIEFSHTIPPLLYELAERYLAYASDLQVRTLLNMRRPDIHVLRLLGVRYLITDSHLPTPGTRRVSVMPLPDDGRILAVDEIPNPNIGISPTTTIRPKSANEALDWIGRTENDFERTAILEGPDPGPLSPAKDIDIRIQRDGIAVRGSSPGRSLVVLPFQFSHCLRAVMHGAGKPPELRRADVALTGLLFDGDLDVTIAYLQGPFQNALCRLDDFVADRRLTPSTSIAKQLSR